VTAADPENPKILAKTGTTKVQQCSIHH